VSIPLSNGCSAQALRLDATSAIPRRTAEPLRILPRFHGDRQIAVGGCAMGRGLLLWLIGIPLPIILVVWLLGGLN
jgi:hypothetical protein